MNSLRKIKSALIIITFIIVLLLVLTPSLFAIPVNKTSAISVGLTHIESTQSTTKHLTGPIVQSSTYADEHFVRDIQVLTSEDLDSTLAYILQLSPEGYIVISPDTDIHPVIAYSFNGAFPIDDPNDPLLHMVTWDLQNRIDAIPITSSEVKTNNNTLWEKYLSLDDAFVSELSTSTSWGPWVKTQWDQGSPYNKYCPCIAEWPIVGGCMTRASVGCTATAMAQIINYWQYPNTVSFTYNDDRYETETLKIKIDEHASTRDFPDFTQLNEKLKNMTYAGDEDESAALCFACGISVKMDYKDDGWWIFLPSSGAWPSAEAYRKKFGYSTAIEKSASNTDFYPTLMQNMKDGQPAQLVIYEKANPNKCHSLVADGFKDTGEYHLNYGWGGGIFSTDGWYFLPAGMPSDYDVVHNGVLDISPGPIPKGIAWLRGCQASNGSWYNDPSVTSFAVLTMLNWGYDESDPIVSKGINYVLSRINSNGSVHNVSERYTYYTSIAILPLAATHNTSYQDELTKMRTWILNSQWDESSYYASINTSNSYYGGWGYGNNTRPDLSNTQWALMGLKAADKELGLDGGTTYDKCANYFLARCRNTDGGSYYIPGGGASIHTMTAASVWSYALCGRGAGAETLGGIQWLTNHYSLTNNDGWGWWSEYYYKVTLSKALTMTHKTMLGSHDWFAELSQKLMDEQYETGNWPDTGMPANGEIGSAMSTCWAIMALQGRTLPPSGNFGMWATLESHADLHMYDPQGRHTGFNYITNTLEENIPGSDFVILDPNDDEVPYAGNTPAEGLRQIIKLSSVTAGSYRIEVVGTSSGPFHLTVEGLEDDEVVTSNSYEGDIVQNVVMATNATATSMEGALTIIYEPLQVLPVLGVEPDLIDTGVEPGATNCLSFVVKEKGGEQTLHGVTMYCTDITSPNSTINGSTITFDMSNFDIEQGGEQVVNVYIPVPADFAGKGTGSIIVESSDGGAKSISIVLTPIELVTKYAHVSTDSVSYDRRTGLFSTEISVTALLEINAPVWLVIEDIDNPAVTIAGKDGTTSDGKPYFDLTSLLDDGKLSPAETVVKRVYFNNPDRVQFSFTPGVRGVIEP